MNIATFESISIGLTKNPGSNLILFNAQIHASVLKCSMDAARDDLYVFLKKDSIMISISFCSISRQSYLLVVKTSMFLRCWKDRKSSIDCQR